MPRTSRITDLGSGHGCFPPSPAIEGSPDVFINDLKALRQGDALAPHGCSNCPPHARAVSGGSPSVYVNGKPLARLGDAINCGGKMQQASGDVYADELEPVRDIATAAAAGVYSASGSCARNCMKSAQKRKRSFVG